MGLLTMTFDRLTLKLVRESHLRWGTFVPNLGIGLWVLELFAMYATDGQTDRRTGGQKQRLLCSLPYGDGGIIKVAFHYFSQLQTWFSTRFAAG